MGKMNVLKKTTLTVMLCLLALSLMAQRFNGGITAGLSASQIDGDTYAGFNKAGLTAGVFTQTELSKNYNLRFEIKYTGKGAAKQENKDNSDFYKRSLHYLELPIRIERLINDVFSVHAGISPGYLFHSNQEGVGLISGEVPGYKNIDLGWLLGAGYQINNRLTLELRYTYSLISVAEKSEAGDQYAWLARQLGYNTGDYNNVVTIAFYWLLQNP